MLGSPAMIHKLDRWAWLGGGCLAFIAGMINAVGYLSYAHQGVTHLTGTTTLAGLAIARGEWGEYLHLTLLVLAFAGGAGVSGYILRHSTLRLGRRYGVVLSLESGLLLAAAHWMTLNQESGSYFASMACGLQNAMASTYSGAVLRTTHISGMITDLGIGVGHWLRRLEVDTLRMRLYALLVSSFFAGGIAGSALFQRLSAHTLYVPAAITGSVAAVYSVYAHFRRRGHHPAATG